MFANALVYLPDEGTDAPVGGSVCVLVETAGEFAGDPHDLGDAVVADRLRRIEELPLVAALRSGGLVEAGLVGQGRDGERGVGAPTVPDAWLSDEVLGDVRARVFRSTPSGDVWRIVEPSGTCVDYAHDDEHRIVSTTGPDGSQTTVEFDDDGAVVSTTFPDGSAEFIEPGQWGTPARIVGRDGHVTEAEVDELGQITSLTDPSGATTTLEYQWAGSGSVLAAVTDPGGLTTRIECDAAGREVARTDAAGLRSSVTRDVLGRPVETMDPAGITEQLSWTPESWLAGITHADGTGIANVYDGEGNLVACTNEIGATTTTEFTVFDKPVAATDASGAVTRLVYNTQMELAAVVNADGHRWDFTRDLDGVVVAERDYNGLTTRFAHDPAERWSAQIAPDGTEQVTVRDVLGRPVRADSIDGTVAWDWDEATGRLLGISSPETTITYRHDDRGRRVGDESDRRYLGC